MNICIITFGPEYNNRLYLSHNAEMGADLFETSLINLIKRKCNTINYTVKKLRGMSCTSVNICNMFKSIENHYDKVFIYYSGHGDHSAGIEFWQTASGNVDQIKIASLINEIKPPVIIFSDCCSSEHNVNRKVINHSYVSFGATHDNEDAMMMYGGALFTQELIDILNKCDPNIKINELFDELLNRKIEVETFSIAYSDDGIFKHELI